MARQQASSQRKEADPEQTSCPYCRHPTWEQERRRRRCVICHGTGIVTWASERERGRTWWRRHFGVL